MTTRHALLTGAGGLLARDLRPALESAGWRVTTLRRLEMDITDAESVARSVVDASPDVVVNTAGWTDVDAAEQHPQRAEQVNATGPEMLARACATRDLLLVHLSTDYVFGGRPTGGRGRAGGTPRPLREDDRTRPANAYGRGKLQGERRIREALRRHHLIVRTAWLFGAAGPSFPRSILEQATGRAEFSVVDDQTGCPTWSADLARGIVALLEANARGTVHVCARDACAWHDLALATCEEARARGSKLAVREIKRRRGAMRPGTAPRPPWSVLDTARFTELTGREMPTWRDGLRRFLDRHLDDLLPAPRNS